MPGRAILVSLIVVLATVAITARADDRVPGRYVPAPEEHAFAIADLFAITDVAAGALLAFAAAVTAIITGLTFRSRTKTRRFKDEIEYLKKKVDRVTSTVDPETDKRLIEEAEKSVEILGINALGPLHHAREAMIEFLAKGGILRIILLDPESPAFRAREDLEKDQFKRILTEWTAAITILKDIETKSRGRIEIRLRSDAPDRALLIIDAIKEAGTKSKMLINYYLEQRGMRGYSGVQFLTEYVAERDRDSFLKNRKYFDERWDQSTRTTVDQLIERYVGS